MGMYFEEFKVGEKITTGSRTVSDDDIMTFADLTGRQQPHPHGRGVQQGRPVRATRGARAAGALHRHGPGLEDGHPGWHRAGVP